LKKLKKPFERLFRWLSKYQNNRQLLAEKILEDIKLGKNNKIVNYVSDPRAWNIYTQQVSVTWSDLTKVFWENISKELTWNYVYPKLVKTKKSFDIYQFIWKKGNKYNFV